MHVCIECDRYYFDFHLAIFLHDHYSIMVAIFRFIPRIKVHLTKRALKLVNLSKF